MPEVTIGEVYTERNMVIALAARLARVLGMRTDIGYDKDAEEGWKSVLYIDLPSGQVSWHIPDKDLKHFGDQPVYEGEWDGHSTETKYRRVNNPIGDIILSNRLIAYMEELMRQEERSFHLEETQWRRK